MKKECKVGDIVAVGLGMLDENGRETKAISGKVTALLKEATIRGKKVSGDLVEVSTKQGRVRIVTQGSILWVKADRWPKSIFNLLTAKVVEGKGVLNGESEG